MVNKHGITGDINSERGNAATFLLKIEGVLDGLFQDMGSLDNSEIKVSCQSTLMKKLLPALGHWLRTYGFAFRCNLAVRRTWS